MEGRQYEEFQPEVGWIDDATSRTLVVNVGGKYIYMCVYAWVIIDNVHPPLRLLCRQCIYDG